MPEKPSPSNPAKSAAPPAAATAATTAPAPAPTPEVSPAAAGPAVPRVLVADQSLPNRRLITEILTSFHKCEVDASSSAEHAFERILHQPYDLFIFAFTLPDMNGLLLDRLAARVHTLIHPAKATAPPVIFLVPVNESAAYKEAQRDARTRGSVPLPISLDVLMTLVAPLLPSKI